MSVTTKQAEHGLMDMARRASQYDEMMALMLTLPPGVPRVVEMSPYWEVSTAVTTGLPYVVAAVERVKFPTFVQAFAHWLYLVTEQQEAARE